MIERYSHNGFVKRMRKNIHKSKLITNLIVFICASGKEKESQEMYVPDKESEVEILCKL